MSLSCLNLGSTLLCVVTRDGSAWLPAAGTLTLYILVDLLSRRLTKGWLLARPVRLEAVRCQNKMNISDCFLHPERLVCVCREKKPHQTLMAVNKGLMGNLFKDLSVRFMC